MGMFDHIRCEYPLPGLDDPTSIDFQTKDTDEQYLHQYTITKDGRLIKDIVHYEDHSDPKAEGLLALGGCMTPVKDGEEDTNYHGWLNFYGGDFEYNAKFTDGKIVEIQRVEES